MSAARLTAPFHQVKTGRALESDHMPSQTLTSLDLLNFTNRDLFCLSLTCWAYKLCCLVHQTGHFAGPFLQFKETRVRAALK